MAMTPADALAVLRRDRARVLSQIDRVLERAVRLREDARDVARRLARFVSPWYSPRRKETGRMLRADRARGSWPARPGMASDGARRLLLDATSVAHGEAIMRRAERERQGVRWQTAPGHAKRDECDQKASRDDGYGRGVYRAGDVPQYPSHIRCRCTLSVVPLIPQ